ncbi:MAG TPA: GtrA family protein [Blastocatellia bacterium]|nr:GtrA family protein [Blastocatellia bacterium]
MMTRVVSDIELGNAAHSTTVLRRFFKFSAVGAGGVIVQAATLAVLLRLTGVHYLAATALAVEAAILHNFAWHRRWTWAERRASGVLLTLLKFNATNGAVSLMGNLMLMFLFAGMLSVNPQVANLISIVVCSLMNFALSDRVVFV